MRISHAVAQGFDAHSDRVVVWHIQNSGEAPSSRSTQFLKRNLLCMLCPHRADERAHQSSRAKQEVLEVCFFVGLWHLGFFADFLDFAFFDGYAAVDDLPVEVGFGVCEYRINNQGSHGLLNSGWFG